MSDRRNATPLVALAVGSCGLVYGTALFEGQASALLAIAGGLAWSVAYVLLRRLVLESADLPDDRLDEREIAVRDRSYLQAYRLLGGAVAVSLVLAIVDDAVGGVVASWNQVLAGLLFLSMVLPSAVLAHRERVRPTPV